MEASKNKDKECYLLSLVNLLRPGALDGKRGRLGICYVCCFFTET